MAFKDCRRPSELNAYLKRPPTFSRTKSIMRVASSLFRFLSLFSSAPDTRMHVKGVKQASDRTTW